MVQDGASSSGSSIACEEEAKLSEALQIKNLLHQYTAEVTFIVHALYAHSFIVLLLMCYRMERPHQAAALPLKKRQSWMRR